jgi:hypothetical protein
MDKVQKTIGPQVIKVCLNSSLNVNYISFLADLTYWKKMLILKWIVTVKYRLPVISGVLTSKSAARFTPTVKDKSGN